MKVKRNKRNRKFLQFYATSYGIKPPYKVVLDGPYLQAALEGKVKILEQIPKLLQAPGETVIMVTKCSIHDLKQKGDFYRGAVMIGSTLKFARCNHGGVIEPGECIKLLLKGGNPDRLFIGAQEVALRHFVRDTPGVPLMFISGQVPILEPPAGADKKQVIQERKEKTELTPAEQQALAELKPPKVVNHKRKKVKGPNPLSVKKKKIVPTPTAKKAVPTSAETKSSVVPVVENVASSEAGAVVTAKKKRARNRARGKAKNQPGAVVEQGESIVLSPSVSQTPEVESGTSKAAKSTRLRKRKKPDKHEVGDVKNRPEPPRDTDTTEGNTEMSPTKAKRKRKRKATSIAVANHATDSTNQK